MNKLLIVLPLLLLSANAVYSHSTTESKADVSLEEKLGLYIAADTVFKDENGKVLNLKKSIDKPTIIAPVYLGCMHECPMLLTGLAQAIGRIELLKPGRDYRVITFSFDEHDTPRVAADKKKNYLKAIGTPFPAEAWTFVTGDAANIKKFTDSIGFRLQRDGEDFSHPVTLVVVAPGGKIVRYIEGITFLPFEVTMALTEASEGKVGSPARGVLMYCFSYDPLKKSYVFNILKVTATAMILFVAGFFAYLMISGKKQNRV